MTLRRLAWTVAAVAVCSTVISSQAPSGHALFEQALAKERVEGNLPEAIKLYERVVAEFASDRALAAQALVQVGLCYEKLGRDEAVRAYERLVRDFADQEDAVEQARVRLAVLRRPAPGAAAAGTMPVVRSFPRAVLSLSPDGMKAAALSLETGQNLTVYDVASQQTTRLTDFDYTAGSFLVFAPAWSPDGRRIAYAQCPNGGPEGSCELRVITLSGESSVISRNQTLRPGGWLPDGSAIVVTSMRLDRTATIGLVPTDGSPLIPLRSITKWTGQYAPVPSVSPDGRWIAFVEDSPGDIHVIGRDGRTAHRITDHPADDQTPVWSPDGRHLAFLSDRGGIWALWAVALMDGQPAGEPVRVKDGMQSARLAGWTRRGLVYSQSQQGDDIYTVSADPATGSPSGSPRLIPYRRTGGNVTPSWSPDGRYLAFVSFSPGSLPYGEPSPRSVVLLPSGGGEPREFPFPNPTDIGQLRWFGDSRGLGFQGSDARGEPTLFRLTLATGEWKTFPLPVPPFGTRIEWNADGSRYFYGRGEFAGERSSIVEHDLQSNRERIVYRGTPGGNSRDLRFSPDRRLLAITWNNAVGLAQLEVVVLDIETGQARRVYDRAAGETIPFASLMWSPGGRALLVRTRTEGRADGLRWIPIDGGAVRSVPLGAELTRLVSPGRDADRQTMRDIVWSPDGSRLAFVLRSSRGESFVIENPLALAATARARDN
jgi:Tol biopolymer transport system component